LRFASSAREGGGGFEESSINENMSKLKPLRSRFDHRKKRSWNAARPSRTRKVLQPFYVRMILSEK
jgi:hypothetical protein